MFFRQHTQILAQSHVVLRYVFVEEPQLCPSIFSPHNQALTQS